MPPRHQQSWQDINEDQPPSRGNGTSAYAPIDPFKPSLAFSLQNLKPGQDLNILEDDRPPIRRPRRYMPPAIESTQRPGWGSNLYGYQNSFAKAKPAWRTVPPRARHHAASPPPVPNIPARQMSATNSVSRASRSQRSTRAWRTSEYPASIEVNPPVEVPMESRQDLGDATSPVPSKMLQPEEYHEEYEASSDEHHSARRRRRSPSLITYSTRSPRPQFHPSPDLSSHSPCPSFFLGPTSHEPPRQSSRHSVSRSHSRGRSSRCRYSGHSPSPQPDMRQASHPSYSERSRSRSRSRVHSPPLVGPAPQLLPTVLPYSPDTKMHSLSLSNADYLSNTATNFEAGSQKFFNSTTKAYLVAFVVDTLPRQIYLNLLLRLPYLYFSRVTRIFEEAEMSMPMIRQGILDAARANAEARGQSWGKDGSTKGCGNDNWGGWGRLNIDLETSRENAAYTNLQNTWLSFIDALLKEWKTLNIISVLLLSAILTILQIESAASDPLTRYSALLSMICALMSLVYGCIYIIRFGTMKKTYKGAAWAQEAQKSNSRIWWNIWVMLAMPATWLAWSVILYIVTITAFIWRTSPFQSQGSPDITLTSTSPQVLIPRILISVILSLGIVYFILIALTLRRYGEMMDQAWQKRIWGWLQGADKPENVEAPIQETSSWRTWRPEVRAVSEDEGKQEYASTIPKHDQSRDLRGQSQTVQQVLPSNFGKPWKPAKIYEFRNIDGWGMPFTPPSGQDFTGKKDQNNIVHPVRLPDNATERGDLLDTLPCTPNLVDTSATAVEAGNSGHSALGKVEGTKSAINAARSVTSPSSLPFEMFPKDCLPRSSRSGPDVVSEASEIEPQSQVVRLTESALNFGESSNLTLRLLSNEAPATKLLRTVTPIEDTPARNKNPQHSAAACEPDGQQTSRDDEQKPEGSAVVSSSQPKVSSTTLRTKLFDLPLPEDHKEIGPSQDDLRRCGLSLEAFGLSELGDADGWNDFKKHIHDSFSPSNMQPSSSSSCVEQDPLSFVLDLWNAKLEFNGVTGFLASCEAEPGDPGQAIYYFHER